MANFYDLNPTQTKSSDGKYIDLVFNDFVPDTDYGLTFAWIYEDTTLGISGESNLFNFKTIAEPSLIPPNFISENLYAINSTLYINWDGNDASLVPYATGKLKQVNVWIKGGDFGENYIQYGTSFTNAGQIQIVATQKTTYCVKLQAESPAGKFSEFSNEFCVTVLKQPKAVSDVRHEWDASGNLSVFWKFDPTFKDSNNDNTMADSFGLQLLQPQGGPHTADGTWWTAVEANKIPPLEQKIIISASTLQGVFGQTSAFDTDYDAAIYVRDKNLQTSYVTGYALSKYSDPLTAPVISAAGAPMAYNITYTANSAFDKIYVYESLDNGSTWTSTPFVTSSNPAYVPTLNSLSRQVKAKFSKKLGGFTDYSNTVSVTPTAIDPTDTVAPANPTNISATATVDANDKTGFSLQATISFTKSADSDCRGYRVRWTTQTSNPVYEYGYVDHPSSGSTVSFTISGLIPNVTYYYQVASVDQFNNTQTYSTSGTFVAQDSVATAEGSLARLKSYISIGGATGDQFKFGTGISESINISTTTTPSLSSGTYHGLLLNKTGNKNNFWLTTGQLRVGTDTQFMYFDGTNLYLTGDINARSGTVTGNLNITSGSLIAGTSGGTRVDINSTGVFAYGNITVNGTPTLTQTTQIIGNATTDAPTFITTKANIANWIVDSTTIKAGGITLNSSTPSIIATNSGSYVGIKPKSTGGTDIVLWAGNTSSPAINSASSGQAGFQVNADGQLYATGAIIKGVVTLDTGSSLGGLLNDTSKVYYSATTPTAPTGGFKTGDSWVDTANGNVLKIWNGTSWVIAQDSEAVKAIANTKTKTTYGSTQPSNPISGDVWFDTNTGINYFKVYNGTSWIRMKDSDITAAQTAAAAAQSSADTKSQTTYSSTAPSSPKAGDIWFDTNFSYFKVWSTSVTPNAWVRMKDADITAAQAAAAAAQGDATNALSKAVKFGVDGSLTSNLAVKLNDGGSIYSTYTQGATTYAKSSYSSDSTPGYFIGWENQAGVIYPAFNIGNANAYVKYSNYTQALEVKGNIVNGGDYWNADGSFKFGGTSGITKAATGLITIGSNVLIQGNLKANSVDTPYTKISETGVLSIISGSKTTTLGTDATLSLVSTSTDWSAGGALNINAITNSYYGNENVSTTIGANYLSMTRSGGTNNPTYQTIMMQADELAGVARGDFIIDAPLGIQLKPNHGSYSSTVAIWGKVNPMSGITAGTYITGSTSYTNTAIRNITVNTTAPSGGSEGDIWIQI